MSGSNASGRAFMRDRKLLAAVTIGLSTFAIADVARAVDKHWNSANALWGNMSAWNPTGVPTVSDIVSVDFFSGGPGISSVNQTQASPVSIKVFNSNTLRIVDGPGIIGGGFGPEAEDGQLGVGGDFIVGFSGTHGTFSISHNDFISGFDGLLNVGNTMRIGMDSGVGTAIQSAGSVTVSQLLRVADSNSGEFTAVGSYNLSGGVLNVARLNIGYGVRGASTFPNMLGTFNLSGSGLLSVGGFADIQLGGGSSTGVLNQNGGTFFVTPTRQLDMARSGGTATWNFNGGSVSIAGVVFNNNNCTLNYTGSPSLSIGQLVMAGGKISLTSGHNKTLRSGNAFITSNDAVIDLNDNSMIAAEFSIVLGGQSVRTLLFRGRNGGPWTGNGLTSTAAKLDPTQHTALGYAKASEVLTPSGGIYTFHNLTLTANETIVKYTYYGDSDLDGDADGVDIGRWATNFTGDLGGAGSSVWTQGDWDYDGDVDGVDAGLWATSFTGELGGGGLGTLFIDQPIAPGAAAILQSMGINVVPEPLGIALLAGVTGALGLRRRR